MEEAALVEVQKLLHDASELRGQHADALRRHVEAITKEDLHGHIAPRYYVAELRRRRDCDGVHKLARFSEDALMRFLCTEAMADMRKKGRYGTLAEAAQSHPGLVPGSVWEELRDSSEKAAEDTLRCMLRLWSEAEIQRELQECADADEGIVTRLAKIGDASLEDSDDERVEEEEAEEEEEDEDDSGHFCLPRKPIIVVSDCTGESAERTLMAALSQFSHCLDRACPVDLTVYKFVKSVEEVRHVVAEAAKLDALVVYTLVQPGINGAIKKACSEQGVRGFDLWSSLLDTLENYLSATRSGQPGRRQAVDDSYHRMIECIEFSRKSDDGVDPKMWKEADILLLGPSRSGKTPLAFYLAQRGFKAANYPLVQGEALPLQLWEMDQHKVFGLTISPQRLMQIRSSRMKTLNMRAGSKYGSLSAVQRELQWCNDLYRKNPKWHVLDSTDTGIEENASEIMQVLTSRRGGAVNNPAVNFFGNPSCM